MSLLIRAFREKVKKEKDTRMTLESRCGVGYPTGFHTMDFNNGMIIHVKNEEKGIDKKYFSVGIQDGTMTQVIGRSQSGKTTWCYTAAANIIRPFKTSSIFADNIERGMSWSRMELLTGFDEKEILDRIIARDKGITVENFYRRIKMIHDLKLENQDKFSYDTGLLDNFGEPIIMLEPTVYILDSIPLLMPEKYTGEEGGEEDQMSGQMSQTAGAKAITQMMRTIIPMLSAANIIVFVINHILPNVSADGRPKQSQLAFLDPGERLPKGESNVLLANAIIRFKDHTKLDSDKTYHVAGKLVDVFFEKSRSSMPHRKSTLLYTYDHGFDPLLSLFYFMKEDTNRIKGAGIGLYVDTLPDKKFSMGNFKDKFESDPELKAAFMTAAMQELVKIPTIPKEHEISRHQQAMNDLYSMCLQTEPTDENEVEM